MTTHAISTHFPNTVWIFALIKKNKYKQHSFKAHNMTNEDEYSTNIHVYMHVSLPRPCSLLSSWFVYRADYKQARGRSLQSPVKTPTETHASNAPHTCPKKAPKTQILSAYLMVYLNKVRVGKKNCKSE